MRRSGTLRQAELSKHSADGPLAIRGRARSNRRIDRSDWGPFDSSSEWHDGCEVGVLIDVENSDRKLIYGTLMRQNHIPANDVERARAAFVKAIRDRPGRGMALPPGSF